MDPAEIAQRPVSFAIVILLCGSFLLSWRRGGSRETLGIGYSKVLVERHYWRCVAGSFVHLDAPHLIVDVVAVWGASYCEVKHGSLQYFAFSALLMVLPVAAVLSLSYAIAARLRLQLRESVTLGYSSVALGWVAALAKGNANYSIEGPGGFMPLSLIPYITLCAVYLMAPDTSMAQNCIAVLLGFGIGSDYLSSVTPYWSLVFLFWLVTFSISSMVQTVGLRVPFLSTGHDRNGDGSDFDFVVERPDELV